MFRDDQMGIGKKDIEFNNRNQRKYKSVIGL